MAKIDLHTHSIYSDGGLSPNRLVCAAEEAGLNAIALTDHDNVKGLEVAILKGKELGVEVVPAVEITANIGDDLDFHILGYFIDWKNHEFQKRMAFYQKEREEKSKKVILNLNNLGFKINFKDLREIAKGTIAQPHLAHLVISHKDNQEKLIKEFGEVPDTGRFIQAYLITGAKAYEPRAAADPKEAIDLIHETGGLAVLAHPCWSLTEKVGKKLVFDDKWLKKLIDLGIDGLEIFAHRDNEEDTKKCIEHFEALADKYNLVKTGGSDFHGFGSAGKELGFKDFYLKIPSNVLENLRKRWETKKKASGK